jgi:hypothetical protein
LARAVEAEAEAFLATIKGVQLPDGRDRSVGTAMVGSVWFRPGSARSRCGGSSCSTAEPVPAMLVGAVPNAEPKREAAA